MQSIREDMNQFREQLRDGTIRKAYRALLGYMTGLISVFKNRYPDYSISGLYQGYLDMTYFAIVPPALKQRGLKIAIVFNYEVFRFEAWLAGSNRQVQQKYWKLIRDAQWSEYRLVTPAKGIDSIVECDLAGDFNFDELDILTARIEGNTAEFIAGIERFLSDHA